MTDKGSGETPSISGWRHLILLFKLLTKITGVGKPAGITDFGDSPAGFH